MELFMFSLHFVYIKNIDPDNDGKSLRLSGRTCKIKSLEEVRTIFFQQIKLFLSFYTFSYNLYTPAMELSYMLFYEYLLKFIFIYLRD